MKTIFILIVFIGCALPSPLSIFFGHKEETDVPQAFRRGDQTEEEEEPDSYEGDIQLTPETEDEVDMSEEGDIDGPLKPPAKRGVAVHNRQRLWPGAFVPFVIANGLSAAIKKIGIAIKNYEEKTCLRWIKRTKESHYVLFTQGRGCSSPIGRIYSTQPQKISIGRGCNHVGIIMHEMMHAVGFWHTQSRPDRNNYVNVMWENIKDGRAHNFNKYGGNLVDILTLPYDLKSIMHYNGKAFSKNGKPTIKSIGGSLELGQREGFSNGDITAIDVLYHCSQANGEWSPWSAFTLCDTNCLKSRSRYCTNKKDPNHGCTPGSGQDTQVCTPQECNAPVNGHWGRWSSWGVCSKACGAGVKTRSRKCDDPVPRNGGANCPAGGSTSSTSCTIKPC